MQKIATFGSYLQVTEQVINRQIPITVPEKNEGAPVYWKALGCFKTAI